MPDDMYFIIPQIKKGKTSYAKWGDKVPAVAMVASHLPNWPRWLRIVAFVLAWAVIIFGLIESVRACMK